jgi:hypothetical protein
MNGVNSWLRAEWDRIAAGVLLIVGLVSIVVSYRGVADSLYVAQQLSYLSSGGIGGLLCVGSGAVLLIVSALRDEWSKVEGIESRLHEGIVAAVGSGGTPRLRPRFVRIAPAGVLVAAAVAAVPVATGSRHTARALTPGTAMSGFFVSVTGTVLFSVAVSAVILGNRMHLAVRKRAVLSSTPLLVALSQGADGRNPSDAAAQREVVFVGQGMTRFHVAGCPTLNGKAVSTMTRRQVSGLAPCGICGAS